MRSRAVVGERAGPIDESGSLAARELEQRPVSAETRELQIGEARLARAEELALAADLEVSLGELEAVGRLDQRLEPLARRVRQLLLGARDQQAERLLRPAADAPAQLVELGEPEAVGLLDDHHGRTRNVHPDLDHRRRDENVELARLEALHQLAAVGRAQAAVQAADPEAAKLSAPQAVGLLFGGAGDARLRLLDQRADDVRLPPLV